MHDIYKLKDMLMDELKEYGQKGEMTPGSLEVIDKLAHATKNICKIIEDCESEEGYSSRYAYADGGSYARGGRGGRGGRTGANQYGSYARDRIGRYSRAEDGMNELLAEMHEIMPMLSEEKRREAQRFVDKMHSM